MYDRIPRLVVVLLATTVFAGSTIGADLPNLKGRTIVAVTENNYVPLNFINPSPDKLDKYLKSIFCQKNAENNL